MPLRFALIVITRGAMVSQDGRSRNLVLRQSEFSFTGNRVRGVIVTTRSMSTDYDFVSRYFAPWVGIPEDPGWNCGVVTENV